MIASVLSSAARYHVEAADCFDFAARIPDGAVNLLWLDGPYNMGKAAWDTFPDVGAFLAFYDRVLDVSRRILAPNGSLYVCTSTEMGARMECKIAERFAVLNSIHWAKPPGATKAEMFDKDTCRRFFPASERIVFAEHVNAQSFLRRAREAAGMTATEAAAACGAHGAVNHGGAVVNWESGYNTPSREQYERLRAVYGAMPPFEQSIRPFTVSAAVPYTDTWTYATVPTQDGKHPCEKPSGMLRDVIAASSRPGDVVCELFMGSGVGGEQAVLQGRRYLGCDADPEWARRALARIERAEREPHAAGKPVKVAKADSKQSVLRW